MQCLCTQTLQSFVSQEKDRGGLIEGIKKTRITAKSHELTVSQSQEKTKQDSRHNLFVLTVVLCQQ